MEMYQDGVEVYCLPDGAKCEADEEERNPLYIGMCPEGHRTCSGDCEYYTEQ